MDKLCKITRLENREDYVSVAKLMYHADPYLYKDIFHTEECAIKAMNILFDDSECLFYKNNFYVAKIDDLVVGTMLVIVGNYDWDNQRIDIAIQSAGYEVPSSYNIVGKYFKKVYLYDYSGVIVSNVSVLESYRQKGIGTLLVSHLIKVTGYVDIGLTVLADNEAAVRLYEKMDFKIVDTFDDYGGSNGEVVKSYKMIYVKKVSNFSNRENVRLANKYFVFSNREELKRLEKQDLIFQKFDKKIYQKIIDAKVKYILDVGSNDGRILKNRFSHYDEYEKIICLEYDSETVKRANENNKNNKIIFYQIDLESKDFEEKLKEIMRINSIEEFDFIHASMIAQHLKNPTNVFKIINKYCKKDCLIFLKDIDDGFNIAYPDELKRFSKMVEICGKLKTSGYRKSGREIFRVLNSSGFSKDLQLELNGISTVGLTETEREYFFETYFKFIYDDLIEYMNDANLKYEYKEDYQWVKENYPKLHNDFIKKDFFFNLGFVIFLGKKD